MQNKTKKAAAKKTAQKTVKKTEKKTAAKKVTLEKKVKKAPKAAPVKTTAAAAKKTAPKTKKVPVKKAAAPKKSVIEADKGFSKKEIEEIVKQLEEKKADIAESIEAKRALEMESGSGGDEADIASRNLDNELLYEISSNDSIMARDIDAALTKIKKGTYGLCEHCHKPIDKKRLKFMPYARYCVTCQIYSEGKAAE